MADIAQNLPDLEGEEARFVGGLMRDMSDEQAQTFAFAYRAKRRDPNVVLVLTLMSFGAFGRIYLGQVGMGIVYLLTLGFCGIGLLVDLVANRSLTRSYNIDMAQKLVFSMSTFGPTTEPQTAPTAQPQPETGGPQVEVAAEPSPSMVQEQPIPVEEFGDAQVEVAAEPVPSIAQERPKPAEEELAQQSTTPPSTVQEPSTPVPVLMSEDLIEELEKLADLRERDIITEEDFQFLKDRLLGTGQ